MRILSYIAALFLSLHTYGQEVEYPKFKDIEPVWQHLFIDQFSGNTIDGFSQHYHIDEEAFYFSTVTDTIYPDVNQNTDSDGVFIQKIDLSTGQVAWTQQYRAPHNLSSFERYSNFKLEDGILYFLGEKYISGRNQTPWEHGLEDEKYLLAAFTLDASTGEQLSKTIGKDTIVFPSTISLENFIIDPIRRLYINVRRVDKESFGFNLLQAHDDLTYDSLNIVSHQFPSMNPDSFYVGSPLVRIWDREKNIIPIIEVKQTLNEDYSLNYEDLDYHEVDISDLNNVHIRRSFDISNDLGDAHPIFPYIIPAWGNHYFSVSGLHHTEGRSGAWIRWFDYEGNYLGGSERMEVDDYEVGTLSKYIDIDGVFYRFTSLDDDDDRSLHILGHSPHIGTQKIAELVCENYTIFYWNEYFYDADRHRVIIHTKLNDDYNYIAAFDAEDFGIARPSSTEKIVKENFKVFPSPAYRDITIDIGRADKDATIKMIDLQGKEIYSITTEINNQFQMDVSDFPQGNYLIFLSSKKHHYLPQQVSIMKK